MSPKERATLEALADNINKLRELHRRKEALWIELFTVCLRHLTARHVNLNARRELIEVLKKITNKEQP